MGDVDAIAEGIVGVIDDVRGVDDGGGEEKAALKGFEMGRRFKMLVGEAFAHNNSEM
jgi:hypothetical protein